MSEPGRRRLGLSRAMRLRHTGEFAHIRQQGSRLSKGCLIANWTTLPPGSSSRLGVITSRKIGKAHIRSRARRLLREAFRLHQHELREPIAVVLVARPSIANSKLEQVTRDYLSVLQQARLLKATE